MVVGFTTTCVQSMPITAKVVSLNSAHGKVYLMQHYVIKYVSDLQQVGGFLWDKEIIEILLKVELNTITLALTLLQ